MRRTHSHRRGLARKKSGGRRGTPDAATPEALQRVFAGLSSVKQLRKIVGGKRSDDERRRRERNGQELWARERL
jgi:hypothetical protein